MRHGINIYERTETHTCDWCYEENDVDVQIEGETYYYNCPSCGEENEGSATREDYYEDNYGEEY